MTVPYTFANISGQIPLNELDANFAAVSAYANTAGTVTASAQPNIASVGTLTTLTVAGNVTADYFLGNVVGSFSNAVYANTAGFATTAGSANIANVANSVAGANVTGTVANATYALTSNTATYVGSANIANVANSVAGANVTGTVANATYALTSNVANYAGIVTTSAQPGITSVGNLTSLIITGNSTVINNSTVGANIVVSGYADIGGYMSAVGNVTGNNFTILGSALVNNSISATGNITGGNLSVGFGNIAAGNVIFTSDGSKFNSAKWAFVETINANLTLGNQAVSTAHNFSYYSTNYNEVLFVSSSGSGFGETLVIPVRAVTANSVWNINQQIGFQWANLSSANVTVVAVGSGPYTTVNFSIYAR
jgi:hypothetical protein